MKPAKIDNDYPDLALGDLFRVAAFIDDNLRSPVPVSMRAFMKGQGTHKKLSRALSEVEGAAQQLLIYRRGRSADGTHDGRVIETYDEARALGLLDQEDDDGAKSKRIAGGITPYARLWSLYGTLLGNLYDKIITTEDHVALEEDLRQIILALREKHLKPGWKLVDDLSHSHPKAR